MNILLIEPDKSMQAIASQNFIDHRVIAVSDARQAIEVANQNEVDAVIMELSLAGHSGLEFLYEFRTYSDWRSVPVIVYTNTQVDDLVLRSRGWQQLGVLMYLYKPHVLPRTLRAIVDGLETRP